MRKIVAMNIVVQYSSLYSQSGRMSLGLPDGKFVVAIVVCCRGILGCSKEFMVWLGESC